MAKFLVAVQRNDNPIRFAFNTTNSQSHRQALYKIANKNAVIGCLAKHNAYTLRLDTNRLKYWQWADVENEEKSEMGK